MKRLLLLSLAITVFLTGLPLLTDKADAGGSTPEETTKKAEKLQKDEKRTLKLVSGDEVTELSVRDYLIGVVAAEMPASFEDEALKAQAVAARSYLQRALQKG